MSSIKIFIVDDHQMLIDGIKSLLKDETGLNLIGESTKCSEAFAKIASDIPDILITDINMPEMNGIEFTKEIKKLHPEIKVLALSMFNERSMISEMLQAGVSGYILKNTGKQELLSALHKIAQGGLFFSEEVSAEMMKSISAIPQQSVNEINIRRN